MKRTPVLIDVNGVPLRESLSYNGGGAGFGGQMAEWLPPAQSADAALLPALRLGNARADDLVRNNGMAEDLQSLVGATVVRRRVYARFLDAVNFVAGNPEADPEQELSDRWVVEQMSELTAMTASFVLATPTETDGALFPGRIMLANTCMWDYRGDECGYNGPAVADEFDKPTTDIRKDRCSKCMRGCEMRGMVANFGGFLSINKLSQ